MTEVATRGGENRAFAFLSKAREAVEKAKTVQELKGIRDQAEAVRQYAKQASESLAIQNHCAEIKIRAERKAGELLKEMPKPHGSRGKGKKVEFHDGTPLSDMGVDKKESHRWQLEASVPEKEFEAWVEETQEDGGELTSSGLRKKAREKKVAARKRAAIRSRNGHEPGKVESLEAVTGTYQCVYMDPPWAYRDSKVHGGVDHEYETLDIDGIAALPIGALLADKGGHVWMWTTWPMIREGAVQKLFATWGLVWKGEIVWDKDKLLLGRWIRVQTEVLVLGVVGTVPRLAEDVRGIHREKSGVHSAKPESFYGLIERFSPGPRIELFARASHPGWDRWGNES